MRYVKSGMFRKFFSINAPYLCNARPLHQHIIINVSRFKRFVKLFGYFWNFPKLSLFWYFCLVRAAHSMKININLFWPIFCIIDCLPISVLLVPRLMRQNKGAESSLIPLLSKCTPYAISVSLFNWPLSGWLSMTDRQTLNLQRRGVEKSAAPW